jgi:hypothetical protein
MLGRKPAASCMPRRKGRSYISHYYRARRRCQYNDCTAAEAAFTQALEENPDSAQGAYGLGRAQLCLYKTMPEKASPAIYEFARAAVLDHANEAAFEKLFEQYHGHDPDGLRQLKELAAKSPLPPTFQAAVDGRDRCRKGG